MSNVTNVIIVTSTLDEVENTIREMNNFLVDGKSLNIRSVEDKSLPKGWYGGNKNFECNILLGAYNHFPLSDFLAFARSNINWYAPEVVQIFVKEQNDEKFRLIDLID